MNYLFNRINKNFFNLLASDSNNMLYSTCLIEIYNMFENELSYKIRRDLVRDVIARELLTEESLPDGDMKSVNDRAGNIIRNFYVCGWLAEEVDDVVYEKSVVMTDEGIALAEFLIRLSDPPKTEYSSYVFNIYNLLNNPNQWESDPYSLCLKPVYNDVKRLSTSLKQLSTSIRKIIEQVVKEETFEELTNNLISYCEGSFIKEYSRLVKEQNIRFFRSQIIKMLTELQDNKNYYELIVIGCYDNENIENEAAASDMVFRLFDRIFSFLNDEYDNIMNDIQRKINIYLNLAVGRARFILNYDDNAKGYVSRVLKLMIEKADDTAFDSGDLFNIYTQEFIDIFSLRYPRRRKVIMQPNVTEIPSMTEEDKKKALMMYRKEAYNPYSKKAMKQYVMNVLGNKTSISAQDFPADTKNDILSIIASAAYCEENGFELVPKNNYIIRNGFILRDFSISIKKGI